MQLNEWVSAKRPQKLIVRTSLFTGLKKPLRHYFGLPADTLECVNAGISAGAIDPSVTSITAIEKNPLIYKTMVSNLRSIWRGHLNRIRHHNIELCELENISSSIDYAFLDFLGSITLHDARWIRDVLLSNLSPHASVSITVAKGWRANTFIPTMRGIIQDIKLEGRNLFDSVFYEMRNIVGQEFAKDDLECITFYYLLFKYCLFRGFEFRFGYRKYEDSQPMFLFRLAGLIRREPSKLIVSLGERLEPGFSLCETHARMNFIEYDIFKQNIRTASSLVQAYFDGMPDRVWQKAFRHYCECRSRETGKPTYRYQAAIHARIKFLENKHLAGGLIISSMH